MKKLLVIIGLNLLIISVFAQDEEPQTLLKNASHIGGWGALDIKLSKMADKSVVLVGGRGGISFNHRLMMGLGGYGIANSPRLNETDFDGITNPRLDGGYGGLALEYTLAQPKLIHVSFPLLVGGGGISVNQYYRSSNFDFEHDWTDDVFFVAEPGINVEVNIHKYVQFGLGASYRYISGIKEDYLKDSDLSGFSGGLTIKVGVF